MDRLPQIRAKIEKLKQEAEALRVEELRLKGRWPTRAHEGLFLEEQINSILAALQFARIPITFQVVKEGSYYRIIRGEIENE